jgi:transposase
MTIPRDLEAEIRRLYKVEKWRVGTIAKQVGVHHNTVRRVLSGIGVTPVALAPRRSIADPYAGFIVETLAKYPTLCASRLYVMVKERGYPGRPDHFRAVVRRYRPQPPAEAYLRLATLPGEQAQVDWAHFGSVDAGQGQRPLVAFVVILSWSRHLFVHFGLDLRMGAFLRGHRAAFDAFGGVPRVLLYDNLKSAVIERQGDAIRFNDQLIAFASHHGYEPRPVAPYRGNEKGRVERAIRYVRDAFFAARTFTDLDDLNAQARRWCEGEAAARPCPEDRSRTVRSMFDEEKQHLLSLPKDRFPAEDRLEVSVGKTPYVRFDRNDYSVPHTRVRRMLTVFADEATVRVFDGQTEVARHTRCWKRGEQIEDEAHLQPLVEQKREARENRGMDRLGRAVPVSRDFLVAVAERGGNLGAHTIGLLKLLDAYGHAELDAALGEVIENDAPHLHAVRQVLDRRRRAAGLSPPVPVALPDDPRVRSLVVKPHSLGDYDRVGEGGDDE